MPPGRALTRPAPPLSHEPGVVVADDLHPPRGAVRKTLESLSLNEVESIRDPQVKALVVVLLAPRGAL